MPRPSRIRLPGLTFHVVQRGNNRATVFNQRQDYVDYLDLLACAAHRYETQVHAYALMTNHVHLLLTPKHADGMSNTLRYVGGRFVSRINQRYSRTGSLWEARFRSSPIDTEFYCLACYRYIELNPVRANIVRHPEAYRWSSYRINSTGRGSLLITPHQVYSALGDSPSERAERYRDLVDQGLPTRSLQHIRYALRVGLPTGRDSFNRYIGEKLGRPPSSGRRGRPKKAGVKPPDPASS